MRAFSSKTGAGTAGAEHCRSFSIDTRDSPVSTFFKTTPDIFSGEG